MKRITSLVFTALCLILALTSCPTPGTPQTGSLSVGFDSTSLPNPSLLPGTDMNPAGYTVTGAGPGGAAFQVTTAVLSVTVPSLTFGTWTVAVEAENDEHIVIGRGQGTVVVHAGQTSTLNIIVRPLDGYGTLDLTVNWNAADTDNPTIDATLTPYLGAARTLPFTITGENQGRFHAEDVQTGYHTLVLKLLDNGALCIGAVEVVRIVREGTTTGVYDFPEINKQTGTLIIDVTTQMDEPLVVSMTGQVAELGQGQTMTVSASVANDPGNVVYVWYVNGDAIGTGQSLTFGNTLPIGVYRLDVTAFTADGRRGGSATAMFHVVAFQDEVIHFPDPNFEAVVRENIKKPTGDIYRSDVRNVESLWGLNRNIENISGIEHFTSLWFLLISNNPISNVTPLAGLHSLRRLYMTSDRIEDISCLAGLISLEELYLDNNQISDITALCGMTSLRTLSLHYNQLDDDDLSRISSLTSLQVLVLSFNQISNIEPLTSLSSLYYLIMNNNHITNIDALAGMSSLQHLAIDVNEIYDINALAGLTSLEYINIGDNQISDISALSGLVALHELRMMQNQISDLSPLVANNGLGEGDTLTVNSNPLSDDSKNTYIPQLLARGVTVYF